MGIIRIQQGFIIYPHVASLAVCSPYQGFWTYNVGLLRVFQGLQTEETPVQAEKRAKENNEDPATFEQCYQTQHLNIVLSHAANKCLKTI